VFYANWGTIEPNSEKRRQRWVSTEHCDCQ